MTIRALPITTSTSLAVAKGLNFLLTLISFLAKPSGTPQYGAYIGLIAVRGVRSVRAVTAILSRFLPKVRKARLPRNKASIPISALSQVRMSCKRGEWP